MTGEIVLSLLDILKIQPSFFCDNDPRKRVAPFHGYKVVSRERLCREHPDAIVVIAAGRYFHEIKRQLTQAGFTDVFSDADVIGCVDLENTPSSKLEKIAWHLAKLGKLPAVGKGLHLPRLDVVVTTRCTLKCRHCSSLMPYYKKPSDADPSRLMRALDRILSCVDQIAHVELLGGEPFLDTNLPAVAQQLLDSGKVLHIDVVTNGTVVPPEKELVALKHDRISVVIDDYGRLSKKVRPLCAVLKKQGIDFRVNRHWAWADLGGFKSRGRSPQQREKLFARCNFNSCAELLDGRLYRCPRSSHGTQTGTIPDYPSDSVDILAGPRDKNSLRKKLKAFYYGKKSIRACDHCRGNTSDSLTLDPAEQNNRSKRQ